mmetsp:Transcript_51056/g.158289  ORF Transcript_51056/g.158289 Transcript_51056/m.158289 type:complete len:352 (-) Transcript_51056:95-1150(-)
MTSKESPKSKWSNTVAQDVTKKVAKLVTDGPQLVITIVGARGVRGADWLPGKAKPDCYCEVTSAGKTLHTSQPLRNRCEPHWNEECQVAEFSKGPLEFSVYDQDARGRDLLGAAQLQPEDFLEEGFNGDVKLASETLAQAYLKVRVKVPGKSTPAGPSACFGAVVSRQDKNSSFGIRFDIRDGSHLAVLEIMAGPFSEYNATTAASDRIRAYDFLSIVNGVSGSSARMLLEFKVSLKVECEFIRSVLTTIVFDRGEDTNAPLGLEFADYPTADFLVITGVEYAKSKALAPDQERVCPGDRIISVACKEGPPGELLELIKEQRGKFQMVILRPALGHSGEGGVTRPPHWLFE